jgi:hypothetical protein
MATKKSVTTLTEELRVMSDAVEAQAVTETDRWLTPDFWTMVGSGVTNLVAVAALLGWLDRSNVEGVTAALTALVGAVQVVIVNSLLVWKYLSGRAEFRARMTEIRYQTASMLAVEKMRIEAGK